MSGLTDVSIFETSFSFWFFLGVDDLVPFSVCTEVNLIVRGLWPSEHTKQAKMFDSGSKTFLLVGHKSVRYHKSGGNFRL